jgi:hypothetical protein
MKTIIILELEDFFIDEIKNGYEIPIMLNNNLFLKPIISKKVSHTYYDNIEKKNTTTKLKYNQII